MVCEPLQGQGTLRKLRLREICIEGQTHPRAEMSEETTKQYGYAMTRGETFPPVDVVHDGEHYYLCDGYHRYFAAGLAGREFILARVYKGTQEQARWHCLAANTRHGLPRSNADKVRAVCRALLLRPEASDRLIARHVGVGHSMVGHCRLEMEVAGKLAPADKRLSADGRWRPATPPPRRAAGSTGCGSQSASSPDDPYASAVPAYDLGDGAWDPKRFAPEPADAAAGRPHPQGDSTGFASQSTPPAWTMPPLPRGFARPGGTWTYERIHPEAELTSGGSFPEKPYDPDRRGGGLLRLCKQEPGWPFGLSDPVGQPITGRHARAIRWAMNQRPHIAGYIEKILYVHGSICGNRGGADPLYLHFDWDGFDRVTRELLGQLKELRPTGVCPCCRGDGCDQCHHRGWVGGVTWDRLAKEDLSAVRAGKATG